MLGYRVDGRAGELVLAQGQLLEAVVVLQHLGEVDGRLLPDAGVDGVVHF
jgi:hypothetical protein